MIGSAPQASILALSIGFGEGTVSSDDQIAAAVRFAVDNGADVINMSLTRNTLDWPESWDDAFLYAAEHDVVVVAAAGNRGNGTTSVGAPATMPGVLTVAGTDRNGNASFDASTQGMTIAVAAPSEDLVGATPGGGHTLWGGTSGAAPIVAGIVALVRAAHPELDAANVIERDHRDRPRRRRRRGRPDLRIRTRGCRGRRHRRRRTGHRQPHGRPRRVDPRLPPRGGSRVPAPVRGRNPDPRPGRRRPRRSDSARCCRA